LLRLDAPLPSVGGNGLESIAGAEVRPLVSLVIRD
jgi:hypothetical protein